MAKHKPKATSLIGGKARRGYKYIFSSPWRAGALAIFLLIVTFGGIRLHQYVEAVSLEDQAKLHCGAYGIKASVTTAQCIAGDVLIPYEGWSISAQFPNLITLWNHESNWRWNATNPYTAAYGIPQALPGSKMGTVGCVHENWQTNVTCQMHWGLNYIHDVYGTPTQAWTFWKCLGTCPRKAGTVYNKTTNWY